MMKTIYQFSQYQMMRRIALTVVTAIITAGCANTSPPVEQMAVSRAAISNASSAGANEFAPQLLKTAIDKMASAELAMTRKNYEFARELAEQAQVDAQLAEATTHSAKAQKAADAMQEDNRILRDELDRKSR